DDVADVGARVGHGVCSFASALRAPFTGLVVRQVFAIVKRIERKKRRPFRAGAGSSLLGRRVEGLLDAGLELQHLRSVGFAAERIAQGFEVAGEGAEVVVVASALPALRAELGGTLDGD